MNQLIALLFHVAKCCQWAGEPVDQRAKGQPMLTNEGQEVLVSYARIY